uniref:Uncharacterized protein n=1 Tax=Catharus ustulatus TaxID=91951 RepID=A0A8C3V270_CATUS
MEQRWLQGVRSTGSRSCASPSATMVGLKPPEVPPTATMKFISAGMAGCIADLCTFPLDTTKVRLQTQAWARGSWLAAPLGLWPWPVRSPPTWSRDAAQHCPQCRHQLRGARHLRPHQGRAAAGTAHGRQRPVPLRGRLWRRVLCHSGGIAGGRGEDAVHERHPRAVQQRPELPPGPAHAGWPRRPLQGLS